MTNNDEPGLKSRISSSRLKLAREIVLRSGAIGLTSGAVLGVLFSWPFPPAALVTGVIGTGLGLVLGLFNGLLLSVITCLFFYPLKYGRLYRTIVKVISAFVAAVGAAGFGPWYFSSTGMTPITAVRIGFSSVLASAIAIWAGWLAGQNIAQWYEQKNAVAKRQPAVSQTLYRSTTANSTITFNDVTQFLKSMSSEKLGWIGVALLSFFCPFGGDRLLRFLVCGTQDVFECLPSPRLYTSVIAGFKVTLPAILIAILIVKVLQNRYKRQV